MFKLSTLELLLRTNLNEPFTILFTDATGIPENPGESASSYWTDSKILDPATTFGLVTVKPVTVSATKVEET